ncbi:MAG: ABC transporter ATP-binding protein [Dehalococcoidia bacterium]|nr:ABC transporter ATP-binding protein [Dehalococcoidia bacterium]MYH11687.1 ABC transporter ATP-binding protein [Rhodothermaceae bacterium]
MALLEARDIVAGYGETEILHGVSITVDTGEIVTIIGPNGCGKSTLMKSVIGLVNVGSGSVMFRGNEISNMAPEQIVRSGLCYVPQTANVFPSLTIRENLDMGAFIRKDDYRARIEEMFEIFPDLADRPNRNAGSLSGGQRQMLAIARALMLDPVMLLLDEPSAGLSPLMMGSVFERIRSVNSMGVSILLVEQNAREALSMSDRGYVLSSGENRLEDRGPALLDNPEIARLYLGG